jgi:hypothetical protein
MKKIDIYYIFYKIIIKTTTMPKPRNDSPVRKRKNSIINDRVDNMMNELKLCFKKYDHQCVKINGKTITWCGSDNTCDEVLKEMHRKQRKHDAQMQKLRDQGHSCIVCYETFPSRFIWCEKDVCDNYDPPERPH